MSAEGIGADLGRALSWTAAQGGALVERSLRRISPEGPVCRSALNGTGELDFASGGAVLASRENEPPYWAWQGANRYMAPTREGPWTVLARPESARPRLVDVTSPLWPFAAELRISETVLQGTRRLPNGGQLSRWGATATIGGPSVPVALAIDECGFVRQASARLRGWPRPGRARWLRFDYRDIGAHVALPVAIQSAQPADLLPLGSVALAYVEAAFRGRAVPRHRRKGR